MMPIPAKHFGYVAPTSRSGLSDSRKFVGFSPIIQMEGNYAVRRIISVESWLLGAIRVVLAYLIRTL
jgi:hypothetical protein